MYLTILLEESYLIEEVLREIKRTSALISRLRLRVIAAVYVAIVHGTSKVEIVSCIRINSHQEECCFKKFVEFSNSRIL